MRSIVILLLFCIFADCMGADSLAKSSAPCYRLNVQRNGRSNNPGRVTGPLSVQPIDSLNTVTVSPTFLAEDASVVLMEHQCFTGGGCQGSTHITGAQHYLLDWGDDRCGGTCWVIFHVCSLGATISMPSAAANGMVYIIAANEPEFTPNYKIYAVNCTGESCSDAWNNPLDHWTAAFPLPYQHVVFVSSGCTLYVMSENTGYTLYSYNDEATTQLSSVCMDSQQKYVYFGVQKPKTDSTPVAVWLVSLRAADLSVVCVGEWFVL